MFKHNLFIKTTFLLAFLFGTFNLTWAQSDNSAVYTSNVTLSTSGGTSATACKVVISNVQYDGLKAGATKTAGAIKITVPARTKYLHMHVAGWKGENVTLSVTPAGYSGDISLTSNSGISNKPPFTFEGDASTDEYYKVITFSNALTADVDLTFTATGGKRFVVFGVNAEDEATASTTPIATIGDLEYTTLEVNDDGIFTLPIEYATDDPTDYEVVWSCDNDDVLYVDEDGHYLALSPGTANVTVTVTPVDDETYHEVSKTFAIEVKEPIIEVTTMDIDFEYPLDSYINWEFVDINTDVTLNGINAHGGEKVGANMNENRNPVTNSSITSKNTVANPGTLTFYISKTTNNTTESNWLVEVSEDGEDWTLVKSTDAKSMTKGEWVEATCDLSDYTDVYVRIRYKGTNAARIIDDITLTENEAPAAVAVEIGAAGAATFSSAEALDFTDVTTVAAYIAKEATSGNSALEFTRVYKVPANTGLIVRNAAGENAGAVSADVPVLAGEADNVEGNLFVAAIDEIASLPSEDGEYTNYILNKKNGVLGFYKANNKKVAAGKAYLKMLTGSGAAEFIGFDGEVTAIESLTAD
ncbi:MAG: hypothetical protein IJ140_03585, partial [Prevotella sp.]|nr:hypothetical protein [Prevotella sp.]